ncbi:hypothetical protein [Virgibacillus chiguensis]|uniref:Uncharacterized protein n=2 Tax=Virgibacillus chiguensis TaxID=411959 RepID=A0A1M5QAB4_9BACI|nr:hypothetical protein [Virgibacillus chiguensis]SHH10741.1 hypothetical protein SAMN05421807_10433 [Virgibacillus chiguensis]
MVNNECNFFPMADAVDLIEVYSNYAYCWTQRYQGGNYTIFSLPKIEDQQGVRISSNFRTNYSEPLLTENPLETAGTTQLENDADQPVTQTVQFNVATPIEESWRLTEAVAPGGNNFYLINKPLDPGIEAFTSQTAEPQPITLNTTPTMQTDQNNPQLQINLSETVTQSNFQNWNISQELRLPPQSRTTVSLQTMPVHVTRAFQFMFYVTGTLGITTTQPIFGQTEHYIPVTDIDWYDYPQIEVDNEFNLLRCQNTGEYTASYHTDPSLLIETVSITNGVPISTIRMNLNTGEMETILGC